MNKNRRKTIEQGIALLQQATPLLDEARQLIEEAGQEERDYFDNMPENMQSGERGEQASAAADALEEIASNLEEANVEEWVARLEEALG